MTDKISSRAYFFCHFMERPSLRPRGRFLVQVYQYFNGPY